MRGLFFLPLVLGACRSDDPPAVATQLDSAAESDADSDSDSDTDADADADTDADTDTEADTECETEHGEAEPLVAVTECGTLSYGLYAAEDDAASLHRLPDFSWAGYRGGGVGLPQAEAVQTLSAASGDNQAAIQDAIDTVSKRTPDAEGLRGAVVLEAGRYEVSGTLTIAASGVVLRGAGQGEDGTVLVATQAEQHDFIVVQGSGSGLGEVSDSRVAITGDVPVGSTTISVASTEGFAVGDTVGVVRTPSDDWITTLGMDAWGWEADSYAISHERRITAVDTEQLTVDIPMVDAIESRWGGGAVFLADLSGRISQVGVEDLRLESVYDGDEDEDHGWVAVTLARVTSGWVRRVSAVHFGYAAVSIESESSFNTVEEVAMLAPISQVTGSRRYAFNLSDGVGNLFQRCYSEQARHDFVSGSRTTGPNVWLDCYSTQSTNDDGPHHRWATGLLLDNVVSHELHVENRQDSGSGHGWSGAQTMFWNSLAEGVRCDAPVGAMNWTVGSMGEQQEGGWSEAEPFGWWESHGTPVEPRSLYLHQLQDRLGAEAVQAVTTPAQREGRIWGELAAWAGDGRLSDVTQTDGDPTCSDGIVSGSACCEAGCGECGGSGCSGRPGGADACCTSSISESGRSCLADTAPCIIDPGFAAVGQ